MPAPALQVQEHLAPRNAILLDCRTALSEIMAATDGLVDGTTSAGDIRQMVQRLHMLKGAAATVGLEPLSNDLHILEGDLGGLLRLPPALRSPSRMQPSLLNALARVRPAEEMENDIMVSEASRPFGEALWWSSQLVQVTAREVGKRVFLMVRGGDVMVPLKVFDILQTSLQHLTRNAVVHGIEQPTERYRLGKPEIGLIRIVAHSCGGKIVVNVIDNGAGIDDIENRDLFRLGESTADGVSRIAGRGIGLAAVQDSCAAHGGTVVVRSVPRRGTAFTMRLPR